MRSKPSPSFAKLRTTAELRGESSVLKADEVGAAILAVTTTLRHPLIEQARASLVKGNCYRELLLTLVIEDGLLVEGIAELVFREMGDGQSSISRPTRRL